MFLSNSHTAINYNILADGETVKSGLIEPNTPFQSIQANFSSTPEEITITFKGSDSPDIYGISLEGSNGVVMDNIPLRGSSGTLFSKQNSTLLGNMYANLSPSLIIMEFGGNTIPYIKTDKGVTNYGRWFKSQIHFMKRLNPNAAIIVIGPGDMSIKEKTEYVTYPYLEDVRDAMQEAALSTGCVFWDMYEVMGGKNSMPKWVEAEPALAASDYIHFSPKGAKKIAEEFSVKLFDMYYTYKDPNYKKEESINDSIQ
jgi:lysophospholipase L1-like esterase